MLESHSVVPSGRVLPGIAAGSLLLLCAPLFADVDAPETRTPETALTQARILPPLYAREERTPDGIEFEIQLELTYEKRKHIFLQQRVGDDFQDFKQELQFQLYYRENQHLSAFGEIKLNAEQLSYADETARRSDRLGERGELWLSWERLFNSDAAIKIGRQNFIEPRRWWWDSDLDSIRFDYTRDSWQIYIAVAETVTRQTTREKFIDPHEDDVLRWLGNANWKLAPSLRFAAFYFRQRDHSAQPALNTLVETARADESDASLTWLGLRAAGEIGLHSGERLTYWLDGAAVTGEETVFDYVNEPAGMSRIAARRSQRVRGHAVDVGLHWFPLTKHWPILALSHARGSGDKNRNDDTDHAFRQTGLQDADQEFRYYGELLRPELSNLSITTALVGFHLPGATRLTLGYHWFRQVYPSPFLRGARIELLPAGEATDIGRELSLLVDIRKWENLKVVLAAATFKAGNAYGPATGERVTSFFVQFAYEF